MSAYLLALLAADDEGGSSTVEPSLGLVLYTLFLILLAAVIVYGIVRLIVRGRRDGGR